MQTLSFLYLTLNFHPVVRLGNITYCLKQNDNLHTSNKYHVCACNKTKVTFARDWGMRALEGSTGHERMKIETKLTKIFSNCAKLIAMGVVRDLRSMSSG